MHIAKAYRSFIIITSCELSRDELKLHLSTLKLKSHTFYLLTSLYMQDTFFDLIATYGYYSRFLLINVLVIVKSMLELKYVEIK